MKRCGEAKEFDLFIDSFDVDRSVDPVRLADVRSPALSEEFMLAVLRNIALTRLDHCQRCEERL